jgi:hypothetical protein
MKKKEWAILDLITEKFITGHGGKVMLFSDKLTAIEISSQLFSSDERYSVINVSSILENGQK